MSKAKEAGHKVRVSIKLHECAQCNSTITQKAKYMDTWGYDQIHQRYHMECWRQHSRAVSHTCDVCHCHEMEQPQPKLTLKATFSSVEEMEEALAQYRAGGESNAEVDQYSASVEELITGLRERNRVMCNRNRELIDEAAGLRDMTRMRDTAIANVDELRERNKVMCDRNRHLLEEMEELRRCERRPFAKPPTHDEATYYLPRRDCEVLEISGETLAELKRHTYSGKVSELLSYWKQDRDTIVKARKDMRLVEQSLKENMDHGVSWVSREIVMGVLKDMQKALDI